ncbi:5-formyltetrahydrofolate cyclo-ligase [Aquicella lusitana]|uniref:5-formyltetrahydrofolate cyclo-ligase n=1 Tax=Aquicella lusitana TaxID=254246 RepID=A0A370GS43_9COXI|nr:5-formyltetrahydrofolate cyclo-ligase [Aquicella lusitana]RDI46525.1 5-formyltetrahydrofolate cyclo-ligase [Aquicella lusitana]VVC74189.1 5-formyltetrahydrofolate cyclo-ligase [Aquicella lusitana]
MDMSTDPKATLRKHFREVRKAISPAYRDKAALAAANIFVSQAVFKQSQHIACYLAFHHEFETMPLIESIWQAQKYCYLPVLAEEKETPLRFALYQPGDTLRPNRYGIPEPDNLSGIITPERLEIVITPLIAFDVHGHRLGTGGGYYDRTFAFIHTQLTDKPFIVGVGYAVQQAERLPSDPWDVTVDAIMTEEKWLRVLNPMS